MCLRSAEWVRVSWMKASTCADHQASIHSLIKPLLSTYCVPGIMLGSGSAWLTETGRVPFAEEAHDRILCGRTRQKTRKQHFRHNYTCRMVVIRGCYQIQWMGLLYTGRLGSVGGRSRHTPQGSDCLERLKKSGGEGTRT